MGQPLRRRHDRADRLLVRLLRDARLRRPADARDRLPLSPVLSGGRRCPHRAGRSAGGEHRPPRRRRSRRRRRRARDTRGAAAAARAESATARISPRRSSITPRPARRSTISPRARPASASSTRSRSPRRSAIRRRGRRLHLRRRPADGVGRALSRDERQAAAARLVLAWLDGERDGAGNWRPGRVSRPPGDLAVGRRRLHHADGRLSHAGAATGFR